MPRSRDDVVLDDPKALRALAHPARLTVIDELYQGNERTASELAELTGLTPSAMSYHLRALERWGVVERGETRHDARERPWRACGRGVTVTGSQSGSAAATDVILAESFERLGNALRRWSASEARETEGWRDVATLRRSYLWVTETEAAAFAAELAALIDMRTAGRNATKHPRGTRRVMTMIALVPEVDEP